MLNHILVPLDASELAETALPYAEEIVAEGGKITLLMVVEELETDVVTQEDASIFLTTVSHTGRERNERARRYANDYLARTIQNITREHIRIETHVLGGNPASEIIDYARSGAVDAIVISTHGRTGISRWLMGSVTQKVINAAPCPVFMIPPAN
ncbi:MAG: universal stress protein [Anaerolineae bacterium]|nr:universal stress protein [Anaerolineae bacterium]MCA9887237.1 universal stress protein [Anaerolineae bacterium]MCA9891659.1 universal stress protein [Anaerolineae bacterium]